MYRKTIREAKGKAKKHGEKQRKNRAKKKHWKSKENAREQLQRQWLC